MTYIIFYTNSQKAGAWKKFRTAANNNEEAKKDLLKVIPHACIHKVEIDQRRAA